MAQAKRARPRTVGANKGISRRIPTVGANKTGPSTSVRDTINQTTGCEPLDTIHFLRALKKNADIRNFPECMDRLQRESQNEGLDIPTMKLLMYIVKSKLLNSTKVCPLIRCMIPRSQLHSEDARLILTWFLSNIQNLPVTVSTTIINWIIGCWEYQVVDRDLIYVFYDVFFYHMTKRQRLGNVLARLVYLTTRPEDVTRRQVQRLLKLRNSNCGMQKHIVALLSLFKSYRPEVMPEQSLSINVQSIWRTQSENIRIGFENARQRLNQQDVTDESNQRVTWSVVPVNNSKKQAEILIPIISYLNARKDKNSVFAFQISSIRDLGIYESKVQLPGNSVSLLSNSIGCHLLVYANREYQSRFTYVLYHTLRLCLLYEVKKFSSENISRLLDGIIDLSEYMQHSVGMVNSFISELLALGIDRHRSQLLALIERSSSWIPHLKFLFYCSSADEQRQILQTIRRMWTNLNTRTEEQNHVAFPFLGEQLEPLAPEMFEFFDELIRELTSATMIVHPEDNVLLSECIAFYEQTDALQILMPPTVLNSSLSRDLLLFERSSRLLLRYFQHKNEMTKDRRKMLMTYSNDLLSVFWINSCLRLRQEPGRWLLSTVSRKTLKKYAIQDLDHLLNIVNHLNVTPFKLAVERSTGMQINERDEALVLAQHYYPNVGKLLRYIVKERNAAVTEEDLSDRTVQMDDE